MNTKEIIDELLDFCYDNESPVHDDVINYVLKMIRTSDDKIKEHWKDVMTSYMQGDCYYATTNKYLNELYENTDISEIDSESDLKYEIERRDLILKKILNIDTFYSSDEYDRMCPIFDEIKKILKMEWSDNIPENGILCLVSDKGDVTQTLRIIKRVYSSFFIDDTEYEWDEAIPVAPDEIMKYIYNPDKVGI